MKGRNRSCTESVIHVRVSRIRSDINRPQERDVPEPSQPVTNVVSRRPSMGSICSFPNGSQVRIATYHVLHCRRTAASTSSTGASSCEPSLLVAATACPTARCIPSLLDTRAACPVKTHASGPFPPLCNPQAASSKMACASAKVCFFRSKVWAR
jgi:hypothetical protein